jgi:aryl-alcohol dehydrogenase-like predicted oxidoreductase
MDHRPLGRTGVSVSKLCLGAMMFGAWGNPDHDDAIRIVHAALDAGIDFVDTADVYSQGESEEIVGKALAGRRDRVVLATKFWGQMGEGENRSGASRRWIVQAVDDSLRRLQTDWIDLFQVHRPSPGTDPEETFGALADLVHQGKIRSFGHSTYPASMIVEAQWTTRERGLLRPVSEQPLYSLLARGVEAEILPTCARYGLGVLTWSPLSAGWLSGRWRMGAEAVVPTAPARRRLTQLYDLALPGNRRKLEAVESLALVAEEAGLTLIELAIAFVLEHPAVTAAIIGPRTIEQLESQLPAAAVVLEPAILDRIDEIVPPGENLHGTDVGWDNPSLAPHARRRQAGAT